MEGWREQDKHEWQRAAQMAAWIINPHIKGRVTADELLGKSSKETTIIPGLGGTAKDFWRKVRESRERKSK